MEILKHTSFGSAETLNPYRYAARIIMERLAWDLKIKSWESRSRLNKLKNLHQGKKAVIICNGPSLNNVDLSLLDGVFTFGLNKINLLFDRSSFRPSSIVAVNEKVIEQNAEFYNQTDLPLFIDSKADGLIKFRKNVTFLHSASIKNVTRDSSISVNQGGTVTFVAMQLAFHMGFEKVALIGCDHYFKETGPANALAKSGQEDVNHFDKNYFAGGQAWHLPDLPQNEYSYSMAKELYSAYGRELYNCTEGGYLEIFPRLSIKTFIEQ